MPVYVWNDLSPLDGCTLVQFSLLTGSLSNVAQAARLALPAAQNTTTGRLLRNGRARKAMIDEQEPAAAHPGVIFWRYQDCAWIQVG